jgi:hypothetical protein
MRWEDERYVRLYTRDTVGWRMLPWQAKALLPLLMRKVDRAGLLELDDHGAAGLAHLVELPLEVVEVGLDALHRSKAVTLRDTTILLPNFLEAQEAHASDAQRKRDQRERARAQEKLDEFVTLRDEKSQNVTKCHAESQPVTPIRSVPSLAVPNQPTNQTAAPFVGLSKTDWDAVYARYPRPGGNKTKGKGLAFATALAPVDQSRLVKALDEYNRIVKAQQIPENYRITWPKFCEGRWQEFADVTTPTIPVYEPPRYDAEPPAPETLEALRKL